jgi:hypothetical protein
MGGGAISVEDDFDTYLQPMNITFSMKTIWIQATKISSGEIVCRTIINFMQSVTMSQGDCSLYIL